MSDQAGVERDRARLADFDAWRASGLTANEASAKLGVSYRTVERWRSRVRDADTAVARALTGDCAPPDVATLIEAIQRDVAGEVNRRVVSVAVSALVAGLKSRRELPRGRLGLETLMAIAPQVVQHPAVQTELAKAGQSGNMEDQAAKLAAVLQGG